MKFFSLLFQGDVHPSTDEKIIPAEEFSRLIDANEILEKATQDAEKLLQETQSDCEELKAAAKEAGQEEGTEAFTQQILYQDQQLKAIRHNLQQMVLPIAIKAAKRIVGKELETFPETIVDIVMQAIAPIADSHRVTIYVNKDDKEYLDAKKPKLQEKLEQVDILTIQERADVSPGGCLIQTESGMINATIENQWKALERAIEKYK